ncbi:hypothetical protein [Streptomyces sp. NBC_00057]|uniref:hypothetical protein n=1 Tax=Streptomyces sp. NBC_00057 TaxID=2975634 RepID=UPI00324A4393
MDIALLRDLRALGQVTRDDGNGAHRDPDAVGVDAPVAEVRRVVGDRALAGATRPRVLAVVAGEALFAVGLGALLGLAVTAVDLAGLAAAPASLSAPVAMSAQWPLTVGAAGVCAVVSVGSALLPRAVRGRSMPVHRRSGWAVRDRAGERDWSIQPHPLTMHSFSPFHPGFPWFHLAMEAIK